jgi:hypothetical protein
MLCLVDPSAPRSYRSYRLDLADDTFLVAAPEDVAAAVADPSAWAVWWPDLQLTVTGDRGVKGRQWAVTGAVRGSLEIWLEPWGDGVILHWYLRAESGGPGRRTARERARRVRSWKRHVHALKDRLEAGREPGRPRLPVEDAGVKDLDGPAEGQ